MAKRRPFNVAEESQKAFEWLWADHVANRKYDFRGESYYVTATDLERRVRAAAAEKMDDKPYGAYGRDAYYSGVRISVGRPGWSLLDACRHWLLDEAAAGRLQCHNFGKGHVSGERFRPVGEPLSPAEEKHFAQKVKDGLRGENKLVHAKDPAFQGWPKKTLCSRAAREAAPRRALYRRPGRSNTRFEGEGRPVTCPRCLKILEAAAESEINRAEARVEP